MLGLSSADERPSRVRIGRVTTRLLFTILPLVLRNMFYRGAVWPNISFFVLRLRFRRNVSKTTGSYWAIGDGLVKTIAHIHWWWIWSNYFQEENKLTQKPLLQMIS
jgi:hypothetical protein